MAFWMKKLAGKVAGEGEDEGNGDAEARAEEERRKAEEEARKAEEERRREEEAKARAEEVERQQREREEERQRAEEERQQRMDEAAAATPEPPPTVAPAPEPQSPAPVIELEPQVIGPEVMIPEDQIEVTPFGDDGPPERTPPLSPMDQVADIAIAQGSQQSMAEQGYGAPPPPSDQRAVLRDMAQAEQRTAETPDALSSPTGPAARPPAQPIAAGPQATGAVTSKPVMAPQPEEQPDPGLLELQRAADQSAQEGDARAEELAKAQRRDRILKAIRGLLGLGGIVGGTVAQMRGNPAGQLAGAGVAGLGRLVGSLGGYEEDTALRQRGARQDEQMTAQQRAAAMRAGQYGRQLDQTDEAQRQRMRLAEERMRDARTSAEREAARADELAPLEQAALRARLERQRAQAEQERLETDITRASNDPESPRSRRAQQRIVENLDTLRRRGLNRTEADIRGMSERELAVETAALGRAAGSRQRGGGGGAGRAGRSVSERRPPASFIDTQRAEYPGVSDAEIVESWQRMSPEDRREFTTSTTARQYRDQQEGREASKVRAAGQEWTYTGDGEPSSDAAGRVREGAAGFETLREQVAEMERILESNPGIMDAIRGGSYDVGTPTGIAYNNAKTEAEYAIRQIRDMGALQGEERQELREAIPSLRQLALRDDDEARRLLRGVVDTNRRTFLAGMRVNNYAPADRGGSGQPQGGGGDTVTVRVAAPDGSVEEREVSRATYERAMERRARQ